MDVRDRIRMLGLIRVGLGAALFVTPRLGARIWAGEGHGAATPIAMRGLGARDAALGMGLLMAPERGGSVRGWLEAGALADAADTASTLFARDITMWRRLLWAGVAASGVYAAAQLTSVVDD